MNKFYYKLAKIFVFIGVLFFVSHLLFPQYTQAATITEDQIRFEFSEMNIANSPEPIIYDDTDSDVVTIKFEEPATTTATSTKTAEAKEAAVIKQVLFSKEEIKEFVRLEAIRAGLNPDEVEKIVKCESNFNPQAVNNKNRNGTKDSGLWQINSIHKRISDTDKFDYKVATKWAMAKRLHDGNWSAWYCARQLAIR